MDVTLDRPSFGFDRLPKFLHKTGELPLDTQFTTLIPFHIKWTMNEVRVLLRDYPLPFIHIPPVHHSQHHHASQRLYAWSLETDMVIAEEVCGEEAIFRCDTIVIPADLGRRDPQPSKSVSHGQSRQSSFTRVWMWILIPRHLHDLFGGHRINLPCTMRCKSSIRLRSRKWIRLIKSGSGIKCD